MFLFRWPEFLVVYSADANLGKAKAMITIWFIFATGEPCNSALVSIQIKIVLCYLAWRDSINVIAYTPSVSWTWSTHLRLISNELFLVTATVAVLWGKRFKKLELFKVNIWRCFIPILCELIRNLFKDHYLQSLSAATLQVNSHLAANTALGRVKENTCQRFNL